MKLDVVKYGHPVLRQKGALQTHALGKLNSLKQNTQLN